MGKIVLNCVFALFMVIGNVTFSSCTTSEEGENVGLSDKISGKWKLLKCNSSVCTWDEYMEISDNTMSWNKKQCGQSANYQLSYDSETTVSAKCYYSSNGKFSDCKFRVDGCSAVELVITDFEGNVRIFAKDTSHKMVTGNVEKGHLAMVR